MERNLTTWYYKKAYVCYWKVYRVNVTRGDLDELYSVNDQRKNPTSVQGFGKWCFWFCPCYNRHTVFSSWNTPSYLVVHLFPAIQLLTLWLSFNFDDSVRTKIFFFPTLHWTYCTDYPTAILLCWEMVLHKNIPA